MNPKLSRKICYGLAIFNIPLYFLGGGIVSLATSLAMLVSGLTLDYLIDD